MALCVDGFGQNNDQNLVVKLNQLLKANYDAKDEQLEPNNWFTLALGMQIFQGEEELHEQVLPQLQNLVPEFWTEIRHFSNLELSYFFESMIGAGPQRPLYPIDSSFSKLSQENQIFLALKGMRYLRMLQHEIGSETYEKIVNKTFQIDDSTYCHEGDTRSSKSNFNEKNPSTILDRFLCTLTLETNENLSKQFQDILIKNKPIDVSIRSIKKINDESIINFEIIGDWDFPIDVEIELQSEKKYLIRHVNIQNNEPLIVKMEEDIRRITVDPNHVLVELNRSNNRWPSYHNVKFSPFVAIPGWSYFNTTLVPNYWEDWNHNRRIAIAFKGGLGADLFPVSPSYFRHNFTFETSAPYQDISTENIGYDFSYNTSLTNKKFNLLRLRMRYFQEWKSFSLSNINYFGKTYFPIYKGNIYYKRLTLSLGVDSYNNHDIWGDLPITPWFSSRFEYVNLRNAKNRQTMIFQTLLGQSGESHFYLANGDMNIRQALWKGFGGEFRLMGGRQNTSPEPYRFVTGGGWMHPMAKIHSFLGQPKINAPIDTYAGLYLATGYMVKAIEFKIFSSMLTIANEEQSVFKIPVSTAFGFGFEHVSLAKVGLYFPIYQSQAIEGENNLKLRMETVFEWNL
jgi:hypothetical protein